MEGTQRAVGWMSGDHDRCSLTLVLEAFRQVFFNTNALPCITIGADVWGESDIMTAVRGVCMFMLLFITAGPR